jgi:hypothetical protein
MDAETVVCDCHCSPIVLRGRLSSPRSGLCHVLDVGLPERKLASPISNRAERNKVTPGNGYNWYRFPGWIVALLYWRHHTSHGIA